MTAPPHAPLRPSRLALGSLVALMVLLMSPDAVWLWHQHGLIAFVNAFLVPAVLIGLVLAILGRRLWLACLVLSPFSALAPVEFFYVIRYGHPSTAELLGTVLATNPGETISFFGWALIPLLMLMLTGLGLALAASRLCYLGRLQWRGRIREWILIGAVALPATVFLVNFWNGDALGVAARNKQGWIAVQTLLDPAEEGFPSGVIPRVLDFHNQWLELRATTDRLKDFHFEAKKTTATHKRQIYVLVIGESSARDHWQLFGYGRPTNPELSRIWNLVPITDMLTSWPESVDAIPLILTRKPITSKKTAWKEASILRAMQDAGFQTWWISNQEAIGKYDSPIATYALEAAHVLYLNHASWREGGSYDEKLLRPLSDVVRQGNDDEFIVLHMMGSHQRYDLRYPPSFAKFRPTSSDRGGNATADVRVANSYDNTILYTDHVLASVIAILAKSDALTALWFESDHGEVLPTPLCTDSGHGFGTAHEYRIPAFFWYSDDYAKMFPERIATLRSNSTSGTLSANTFESLVDMAGLNMRGHDESMSLFSPQWRPRPRIVNNFWQVDFDKAKIDDKCSLVIPTDP